MGFELIMGIVVLSLPLFAAIGLVIYMAGGKGKPAATQSEIEEAKRKKMELQSLHSEEEPS